MLTFIFLNKHRYLFILIEIIVNDETSVMQNSIE